MIVGTEFFDAAQGGDPVSLQHFYWFMGHPESWLLLLKWFVIVVATAVIVWRLFKSKRYLWTIVVLAAFTALISVNAHVMQEAHGLFVEGRGHEASKLKVINWVTTFLAFACFCGFLFERVAKYRDS